MNELNKAQATALLKHIRANQNADPVKLLASVALQFIDMYLSAILANDDKAKRK